MKTNKDCIFCKIVAGEIPCTKIYEDEQAMAFMDIMPLNRGHLLVIPKEHFGNILEIDCELYGRLTALICKLAKAAQGAIAPDGFNVMQLNGKAASQVVPHLHIHLVPRWGGDGLTICSWEPRPGDADDISAVAKDIMAKIPK